MSETLLKQEFFGEYPLARHRGKVGKQPASHQVAALAALEEWFKARNKKALGGILVLPTGGGKTFTALRFLTGPLSQGYKVLWLAHTHHLLEQAWHELGNHVGQILEPKPVLKVRVVSGTKGHCAVRDIKADDDMLIGTLQTVTGAVKNNHAAMNKFLESAGSKLCVVFDEAHHSPAFSFRRLLEELRRRCPEMVLLGLTATPTYTDETRRGWLKKLFPQEIIHSVRISELQAAQILSRPRFEDFPTNYSAEFDERDYLKWKTTYRDIPDEIITRLAENRERNECIAETYAQNRKKYGKTIIFADRWYQCQFLCEALGKRGVKADVVYSASVTHHGTAEERYRRTADENKKALLAFKNGKIDVLINVRMLTEGTDVPDVQTVFLTRQTTSSILLTQMIGRALRGPKFNGTPEAYVVSFIDNWKHLINWADYRQLAEGLADEGRPESARRLPVQFVSIELVRRLSRQMDSGVNVAPAPFRSLMPAGWYQAEFQAAPAGEDDVEWMCPLLLVFENEVEGYKRFLNLLAKEDLRDFEDAAVSWEATKDRLEAWLEKHFAGVVAERSREDLLTNLMHLARHVAQNGRPPAFFEFEEREHHNLDLLAEDNVRHDRGSRTVKEQLEVEYARADRYWRVLYPTFGLFKSQYDACVNRILGLTGEGPAIPDKTENRPFTEPTKELKDQLFKRDHYLCLCCQDDNRRQLRADHIFSSYHGGPTDLDNLQTLCSLCNGDKGISELNFRNHRTTLSKAPDSIRPVLTKVDIAKDPVAEWSKILRRILNFFYRCGAVNKVVIGRRGDKFYNWGIELYAGNNPSWLKPFLKPLARSIRKAREEGGKEGPHSLTVWAPGAKDITATSD